MRNRQASRSRCMSSNGRSVSLQKVRGVWCIDKRKEAMRLKGAKPNEGGSQDCRGADKTD